MPLSGKLVAQALFIDPAFHAHVLHTEADVLAAATYTFHTRCHDSEAALSDAFVAAYMADQRSAVLRMCECLAAVRMCTCFDAAA